MEILKAELRKDEIFVEAMLDGELRRKKYPKDTDDEAIEKELNSSEENMKQDKVNKEKYKKEQKENEKANDTIEKLLSNKQ